MNDEDINDILNAAQMLAMNDRWIIHARAKNDSFRQNYLVNEDDLKNIILGLTKDNFDQRQRTKDTKLSCKWLYVFIKEVTLVKRLGDGNEDVTLYLKFGFIDNARKLLLVSCHKAEHPAR